MTMRVEGIPWEFVETPEVIALQRSEILRSGAPENIADEGCVDRSIAAAINAAMYSANDDAPDLISAAAHLVFYIAKNHCFTDGSKRAALMSLLHVLNINQLELDGGQEEVAALINALVEDRRNVEDLRRWLTIPGRIRVASD